MVCIPVAGPWVKIPAPAGGRRVGRDLEARVPAGRCRRRRRARQREGGRGRVPGPAGQPRQSRHHHGRVARLQGHVRGPRRQADELPAVHRLHSRWRRRRRARRRRSCGESEVKPGEPITVRVVTLEVDPGKLARATLRCRSGERLVGARHGVGMYTAATPTRAQLAAVRVVRVMRDGQRARERDATRPARERAGRSPDPGGVREVRVEWPLALLALLIVPIAMLAYWRIERRRARYAVHYTNIEVLAARGGRRLALAGAAAARARAAGGHLCGRRARAAAARDRR